MIRIDARTHYLSFHFVSKQGSLAFVFLLDAVGAFELRFQAAFQLAGVAFHLCARQELVCKLRFLAAEVGGRQ